MAAAEAVVTRGDESDPSDDSDESPHDDSDTECASIRSAHTPQRQTLTELQSACLPYCIELLNQRIHNYEYDMAMICALAALGPVRQPVRLRGQRVLYESGGSRIDNRVRGRSSFEWVRRMMDGFMIRGCGSPMQLMLDLRGYGLEIAFNTISPGHVDWSNGDTLQYKSVRFTMADFRGMVAQLQQAARRSLVEDVMFATDGGEIPGAPWQHLYDDTSNNEPGWSFLDDRRDGSDWLFDRIRTRKDLHERFVRPGTSSWIDQERIRDWFRQVVAFRGKLLALMHMTGGQTARRSGQRPQQSTGRSSG
ncbi:hypothetical protein KC316_g1836 [Hortaea werneckii]|nr:hypothetical protein KC324_g1762 [Hortaea werneckii]KAI7593281.1 hypothetical protein KC316_g1836 [Hortaea werneckii]